MNIAEIKGLDDGSVIPPFTATVQFVNEHKGKVQTLKLTDGTGDIKAVLIMRPEVTADAKGRTVRIEKAMASDNTYNGKTTREVKLLGRGVFELEGSASPQASQDAAKPAGNGNGASVAQPVNGNGKKASDFFQGFIHDAVNIQVALYRGGQLTAEHFGSETFPAMTLDLASGLVRVCKRIDAGKLAPTHKERHELLAKSKDKTIENDSVIEKANELFASEQENSQEEGEQPW